MSETTEKRPLENIVTQVFAQAKDGKEYSRGTWAKCISILNGTDKKEMAKLEQDAAALLKIANDYERDFTLNQSVALVEPDITALKNSRNQTARDMTPSYTNEFEDYKTTALKIMSERDAIVIAIRKHLAEKDEAIKTIREALEGAQPKIIANRMAVQFEQTQEKLIETTKGLEKREDVVLPKLRTLHDKITHTMGVAGLTPSAKTPTP